MPIALKESILSCHKKTEAFFKRRKKEANWTRAIIVFVIAVTLISLVAVIGEYDWNYELLSLALQSSLSLITDKIISNFVSLGIFLFLPGSFFLWFLGRVVFKSSASFPQFFYAWSLPLLILPLTVVFALIIGLIYQPLTCLSVFLFILWPYFTIVAIKTAHNITYPQTILLLIITNICVGVVIMILYYVYLGFIYTSSTAVHFAFNITNNSDGSFTATYAYISNTTGLPTEICYVTFPAGWKPLNKENKSEVENRLNKTVPLSDTFYKNKDEFIYFEYGLPRWAGFKNCEKDENGEYWLEKGFDTDYGTYATEYMLIEENLLEICDSKVLNKNKTLIRHLVRGDFIAHELGFAAIYQSPYGEDQDLYFIIDNIQCYKGEG